MEIKLEIKPGTKQCFVLELREKIFIMKAGADSLRIVPCTISVLNISREKFLLINMAREDGSCNSQMSK